MHLTFDPDAPPAPTIRFEDFLKVDIRVGTVVACTDFPEARNPSFKFQIDFGSALGVKKSCAQLTGLYTPEDLLGQQVLAVVNFPPRQIGPAMSEVLLLGLADEQGAIARVGPDRRLPNGTRLA